VNRTRTAGYVLVVGVALYLVGILLPYAYFHAPSTVPGLPSTQPEKALSFLGPLALWRAATPLVLMLVVSLVAFALLWPLGTPTLLGGIAVGIGAELLVFFLGQVILALHPPLGEAGSVTTGPGAYLAPFGAFLVVVGGLLPVRTGEEGVPEAEGRMSWGVASLVGGVGLIAATYFTPTLTSAPALLSLNTRPLHWSRPEFWLALAVLLIVAGGLWLAISAARRPPPARLVGVVAGFAIFGILHFGAALGELVASSPLNPGPGIYLGLVGSGMLLVGAVIVGAGRRSPRLAGEPATVSP